MENYLSKTESFIEIFMRGECDHNLKEIPRN